LSETHKGIDFEALGNKSKGPSGKNHLLVIAIDAYEHCPKLSNCVKDARDFAALMQEHYHFKVDHIYTLYNEKANRANVLRELKALRSRVGEQDNLIIYFSGHGEVADEEAYWVPVEGKPGEDWDWIPADRIKRQLNAVNSFHTLVIVDACFSGSFFLSYKSSTRELLQSRRSRLGISASHSRERALDGQAGENSPFAKELLRILRHNQQPIPVDQLFTQVRDAVASTTRGRQTPIFKNIDVKGDDQGQFVFTPVVDEATAWKRSQEENSILAYQGFLELFPQSSHVQEARKRLKVLQEAENQPNASIRNTAEKGLNNNIPISRKWLLLGLAGVLGVIVMLFLFTRQEGLPDGFAKLDQQLQEAMQSNDLQEVESVRYAFSLLDYDGTLVQEKLDEIDQWIMSYTETLQFPEMVTVKGESFMMGCLNEARDGQCEDNEKPVHEVKINDFSISRTEITNRQFAAFLNEVGNLTVVEAGGGKKAVKYINLEGDQIRKPRISLEDGRFVVEDGYQDYPVNFVPWPGAKAYATWLSKETSETYRLPTESEWEYAARGGQKGKEENFRYSGSSDIAQVACYLKNSNNSLCPAGSRQANQLSLLDFSGNVKEWCEDHYIKGYEQVNQDGTARITGNDDALRVIRGGGYGEGPDKCRVSFRTYGAKNAAVHDVGFRVLKAFKN